MNNYPTPICDIAPAQMRAARGMLGWTRSDLAKRSDVSAETVKNAEHGIYSPTEKTLTAFAKAFAEKGVHLVCYETIIPAIPEEAMGAPTLKASCCGVVRLTASVATIQEESQ